MPLLISNKRVNRISGPISMHILYPNLNSDYIKLFPKAPIFILFGDEHFSDKGYCIVQKADKDRIIHYHIFDKEFLQLFSDQVGDDGVDFYLEGGAKNHDFSKENEIITTSLSGKVGPMYELWKLFRECYRNTRMGREPAKDSGCDAIKNIRWQSSDIRFFGQYDGNSILFEFNNALYSMNAIKKIQEIIARQPIAYKNCIEYLFLTQDQFINKYLENDESLIVKQLKKIKDDRQKTYLINMFKDYIDVEYNKVEKELLDVYMRLKDAMIRMSNYDLSEDYMKAYVYVDNAIIKGSLKQYIMFTILLHTKISDLYILARSHKYMAKTNEESKEESKEEIKYPLVNIIYYGDDHVNNLVTCLGKNYNSIKKIPTQDGPFLRCLSNLLGDTDLNTAITELKTYRSKGTTQEQDKSGGKPKRRTK